MAHNNQIVVVTGATGFIASHIITFLLKEGFTVRGTVRDAKDTKKTEFLKKLDTDGRLSFYSANLIEEGSFDEAIKGSDYVIHTASPYTLNAKDPEKDLVDPAIRGTLTVLESCSKTDSVKRVVLTSSLAAITDSPDNNHIYTEKDWNNESSLSRNPYYYSKKVAEEKAWNFMKTRNPPFSLIVMNPFLVTGPELNPDSINTTTQMFVNIFTGKFPGIFSLGWGFVDVRDVAKAHILAMKKEDAEGRYLLCNQTILMDDCIQRLHAKYPNYSLPTTHLNCSGGDFLVKFTSYFQEKGNGQYLRTNIGKVLKFDNSKSKTLGLEYKDLNDTLFDTVDDLIQKGHIPDLRDKEKTRRKRIYFESC